MLRHRHVADSPMHDLAALRLDDPRLAQLFGDATDPMSALVRRAEVLFPQALAVLWEGDPATFRFSYVSPSAEQVLGYPAARWCDEPTFWTDVVVHPEDRNDAVAYCALATAKRQHHRFEYRARTSDGRMVWLHDLVRVVLGPSGIPSLLRGVMFDITPVKVAETTAAAPTPSIGDLERL